MSANDLILFVANIFSSIISIYLFYRFFNIFLSKNGNKISTSVGVFLFLLWQICINNFCFFPAYVNIGITTVITLFSVNLIYVGSLLTKCVFGIAFNAVWMMLETLSGYILLLYCDKFSQIWNFELIGSFISKFLFLCSILSLEKVFAKEEIKILPVKYSIMLVFIPIGSIFTMNNIFMLSYKVDDKKENFQSALAAVILLGINILVFYIYIKLAETLQLKRMNSIYEQQLELCERHQKEKEISFLQFRDERHNLKNNLISILAYAENGENSKIIDFVNDILEESGLNKSLLLNSGNLVVDSLIGYWKLEAEKEKIKFSINISVPMMMPFKSADLSLILGNLLENAFEAAKEASIERFISINMRFDKNNLLIFIENSHSNEIIKTKDNEFKSTKKCPENHGVGLPSVQRAAVKYHGSVIVDCSSEMRFKVKVVLYGE